VTDDVEQSGVNVPVTVRPVPAGVEALRVAIVRMMDDAAALVQAGDWEALVRGLEPLQQVLGDLRMLEQQVKRGIADTMPERRVTVEGVGTVERKAKTTRRNWDSDELLRKIISGAILDEQTGELPSSPMVAADLILQELRAVMPITGSLGWRVTALRERGIDPDEWCEQDRDGYTVSFLRDRSRG